MTTLQEPRTSAADSSPASRRNWLTFSLRSLLFFSILAVLVVSHLNTNYQWQRERLENRAVRQSLQQEIEALRTELGYFRIEPRDQAHVLNIPQIESGHYLWRIYLPPGTKWKLQMETTHSVDAGGTSSSTNSSSLETGEFLLRLKLYRAEDGNWKVGLMLPSRTSTSGLQANSAFAAASYSTSAGIAGSKLERHAGDKPINLLNLVAEATKENSSADAAIRDEIRVVLQPDLPSAPPPSEKAEATVE